jgi:hypothetical protein
MPVPPNAYDHIRWRRLPDTAHRRTRPNPVAARFPLRPDPPAHGGALHRQTQQAFAANRAGRAVSNIDPNRLVVLEMNFLEMGQRDHLQRLGIDVVDEQERRIPLQTPHYSVPVKFQTEADLTQFLGRGDADGMGLIGTQRQRKSTGAIDDQRLELQFRDKDAAARFISDTNLAADARLQIKNSQPVRKTFKTTYRLLGQFRDHATVQAFEAELGRYRATDRNNSRLTGNQRWELFDALDEVKDLAPEDRKGERLRATGDLEQGREYYIDVDLWHPGRPLLAEAIRQFEEVVASAGGRVTDAPTSVADSFVLARVRGSRNLVNALIHYDRVALVDLPPQQARIEFGVFSSVDPPRGGVQQIGGDGPLACIVDSGVVSGHPLLSGVVVDERDFGSGEDSVTDTVGHGTHISGAIVYGDICSVVSSNQWTPKVRLLSAKVMKRSPLGHAEFADGERVETQVREAIRTFAREYGCRVFNLSFGNLHHPYKGGRQLPWAQVLDELCRELDIVCITSAGNVNDPAVPAANSIETFQQLVREQILSEDHPLIDPATSMLSITVGAICRGETGYTPGMREEHRPPIVGAPTDCPSPFTRAGNVSSDGPGPKRAVKPEVIGYGGNYALSGFGGQWNRRDPFLGIPSLRFDYQGNGLLSAQSGTSVAAGYVTHCAAIVESELRRALGPDRSPTANLVRCLTIHSARHPDSLVAWMGNGHTESIAEERLLRVAGFGLPNPERAAFSLDQRVTLIAEDRVQEDHFHLYELELPPDFVARAGVRTLRVSLAYDPPTRGTRKEYLGRTMWFEVYRGLTSTQIFEAMGRAQGTGSQPQLPAANQVKSRPPCASLEWSTVQSAVFEGNQVRTFDYRAQQEGPAILHILVGCTARFVSDVDVLQHYALAVSLEHSDANIRLHQVVRQRVEQRIRIQYPAG